MNLAQTVSHRNQLGLPTFSPLRIDAMPAIKKQGSQTSSHALSRFSGSPCQLVVCYWSPSVAMTDEEQRPTLIWAITFQLKTTDFADREGGGDQKITKFSGRYVWDPPNDNDLPSVRSVSLSTSCCLMAFLGPSSSE